MKDIKEAELENGQIIQYVVTNNPPRGGMKYTYFAPNKSYVVQFFNDYNMTIDDNIHKRIEAIIGRYNPTVTEAMGGAKGNNQKTAEYFSKCFCWPLAIVRYPEFGIVSPAYSSNFFFNENSSKKYDLMGVDKKSYWFTSENRKYLNKNELGDFKSMIEISIMLSRSIRRMHQAGLAHSDLSCNNVLIDPKTGTCVIIDIDTLVVPGMFPPKVIGTSGYIAPEILKNKGSANVYTDLFSLSVLIYEYLLLKYPFIYKKQKDKSKNALTDEIYLYSGNLLSNIHCLGPYIEKLFLKSFTEGINNPYNRPTAMEWERGLIKTWNLLHECTNPECEYKWFVLYDINNPVCPFCKTKINNKEIVRFKLKSKLKGMKGQWLENFEINVSDNLKLYKWNIYNNIFPDEKTDCTIQAIVNKKNDVWTVMNKNIENMISPYGNIIPKEKSFLIKDKSVFTLSNEDNGMIAEVIIKKL